MSKSTKVIDISPQRDRFIETARALGADEDEAAFKAKLAVIARHKPGPTPAKAPRKTKPAKVES